MGGSKTRVGMVMFVLSEATFFLMLVIAYVFYQGHPATRGEAAHLLDPWRTGFFSVCLFASSYAVRRAGIALRGSRTGRLHAWLGATVLLGAVFLVGQAREYLGLLRTGQSLGRDLFGSSFFTLTGFHGFHVFVGLVALASYLGLSLAGRIGRSRGEALEAVSIYWHFVDGVWVVIFAVVYLWAVL